MEHAWEEGKKEIDTLTLSGCFGTTVVVSQGTSRSGECDFFGILHRVPETNDRGLLLCTKKNECRELEEGFAERLPVRTTQDQTIATARQARN